MIDAEILRQILAEGENERVEFTSSTNKTDKFSEAVCAFANDLAGHGKPGYLIIGADDAGRPTGINVTDELLQSFAGLRNNGRILPVPQLHVQKIAVDGKELAVLEVLPCDSPPVSYDGKIWTRTGPVKSVATRAEEMRLAERATASAKTFDARPARDADMRALSLPLFDEYRRNAVSPETIEENQRSIEHQMAALRFYDMRASCPTHAGILLFGSDPRYYIPGAYVQFLRIDGENLTDALIDQEEISGDLSHVLRDLEMRVRVYSRTISAPVPESSMRRQTLSDYPEWAVRELLANAVMHRDYQSNAPIRFYWYNDRIEIQNSGGLYGDVTKETFGIASDYRNPTIAAAMKIWGYVERFGSGINRTQEMLKANGHPPPEFSMEGRVFSVTIRKR